jgi:hypothetical protein
MRRGLLNPGFKRGKLLPQDGDFLILRSHGFGQHRNDRHGAEAFPVRCHHMARQLLGHKADMVLVGHIFFERAGVGLRRSKTCVASSMESSAIPSFHSREEPYTRLQIRTGRILLLR